MQLSVRALVVLACALTSVSAQDSNYTTGLVAALNAAGLTALAGALGAAPAGLLSALQSGNHSVFAPSNTALGSLNLASLNISNLLAYHVTAGPIDSSSLNTTDSVVRTALTGAPAVNLPGNQTQVLVVNKASNGTLIVKNAGKSIPVTTNTTYQNLQVNVIDTVLTIPGNLSSVVGSTSDLSSLAAAVTATVPGLVGTLEKTQGLTLFAPINSAIAAAGAALGAANSSTVEAVLKNHYINGTALYSSLITDGLNITSAGGEPLTFVSNSTGVFVTSGSSSAKVVQANVLTSNGVVHLIDAVLLNTASNPDAASSAAASISSAQASATGSQTGAVTPTSSSGSAIGAVDFSQVKYLAAMIVGTALGATLL